LKTRDPNFIEKTKEYYLTDNIVLSAQDVIKIQYRLTLNCWYQYFKNHVEKIKTWIDFEQKIEEVLIALAHCVIDIEKANTYQEIRNYLNLKSKEEWKIKEKNFKILKFFELWIDEEYVSFATLEASFKSKRPNLNSIFCHGEDIKNGFNPASFLAFIYRQLDEFIEIFNLYINLIVDKLKTTNSLIIDSENWQKPEKIFSFNYTNTYQRIHDNVAVDFLHGSSGENQNIVLGVSDLKDESLKTLKAYGFTKYHQKLFKDTQYLFLDKFKKKIQQDKKDIEELKRKVMMPLQPVFVKSFQSQLNEKMNSQCLDLNFYIWGHSLDYSDKDYILDLFSLNDDMDRNVSVIVYYFDQNAKFALLNNLLAILEKDKVEQWMKNKWLQFKPNPEIKFNEMISEKTA
jgi:hypothetical protein